MAARPERPGVLGKNVERAAAAPLRLCRRARLLELGERVEILAYARMIVAAVAFAIDRQRRFQRCLCFVVAAERSQRTAARAVDVGDDRRARAVG